MERVTLNTVLLQGKFFMQHNINSHEIHSPQALYYVEAAACFVRPYIF